jgi:hypothetical protein
VAKRTISVTPADRHVQFWKTGNDGNPDAELAPTANRFVAARGLQVEVNRPIVPLVNALLDYLLVMRLLEI